VILGDICVSKKRNISRPALGLNPDKLHLPRLRLMSAGEYRKNSIELKIKRRKALENEYSSKMTWSQYLPAVSLYANYYDTDQDIMGMNSRYSNYGLRITMPININAPQDIEASRVEYLRSMVELQDSRKKVENEYRLTLKTIRILDKKISLALSDERLYRDLLKTTKEQAQSGEKTKLDIETMRNSMKMARLDAMIYRIEKQIELLKLYEKVSR
jgi:outer membrane protein TolC